VQGRLVLAHRGWPRQAAENSLPALEAARALGCAGAEFDVRVLRDGTAVLHHDADVQVAQGRRALNTMTFDEFQRLRPEATRLSDVIDWARGHPDFWLDVEVKEAAALRPTLSALGDRTNAVAVTSFDLTVAAQARRQAPKRLAGWISDEKRPDLARLAADVGLDLLVVHRSNARGALLADASARNLQTWAWGVNWAYQMRSLASRSVTGFITDAPRRLLA
jgi:glycerophosphoryl diester phosphodiesterase